MELFFFCSSKQGKGYTWSCMKDKKFNVCDGVGEKFIDEYLSISSLDFFSYKHGKDIYIVQKKMPYPKEDYTPIIDVSLSRIYINIVIKVNNDDLLARQILMFIISDYGNFSKICYDAYKHDDVNSSVGYSFENSIVDEINEHCKKINKIENKSEKKPPQLQKVSKREALGRIASCSLNEGITIASLSISEGEYRERFECLPNYTIKPLEISKIPKSLKEEEIERYIDLFKNVSGKKKRKTYFEISMILIGICFFLYFYFRVRR